MQDVLDWLEKQIDANDPARAGMLWCDVELNLTVYDEPKRVTVVEA